MYIYRLGLSFFLYIHLGSIKDSALKYVIYGLFDCE